MKSQNNTEHNETEMPYLIKKPYSISAKSNYIESKTYNIRIAEEIIGPSQYSEIIEVLNFSTENDNINIHLNCYGGELDTALEICNAIQSSSANITTYAQGIVASAASLIFLSSKSNVIMPGSSMMCHNFSAACQGKGNEMSSQINFLTKKITKIFKRFYKGFLSKKELKDLVAGHDLWLNHKQIAKRLNARKKANEKNNEQVEEEDDILGETGGYPIDLINSISDVLSLNSKEAALEEKKPKKPRSKKIEKPKN